MRLIYQSLLLTAVICCDCYGREWSDATGKYRIEAELVAVRGDKVVLEKKDGLIVTVPIDKLSGADQTFLKQPSKLGPLSRTEEPNPVITDESANATVTPEKTKTNTKLSGTGNSTNVEPEKALLVGKAQELLRTNCFRCHGNNGSNEGGFGFAMDREKLVSAGYVLPKHSMTSPMVERLLSKESPMPPEGESPRPSQDDIQIIRSWIEAGAPSFAQDAQRPYVSPDEAYKSIANDLKSFTSQDRAFKRYFSTVHLANLGVSVEELETYKVALSKLLNSLSWSRQLASLNTIANQPYIFRIDLRDLKWTEATWQKVVERYPHGLVMDSREAHASRIGTASEIFVIRADWFVARASRPPLYHELAQIPSTDTQLEALLQVDVKENLQQGRVLRIGFARSGVSQHNRLIERHASIFGAYWKSYDFASSSGRKNLFENPLGPGSTANNFVHDGGEIIFHLPNGLLGFMLIDANGNRIDRGPTEIVSDPRQLDRSVVNGISCMSCHYNGLIPKTDEILPHVRANSEAFIKLDDIVNIYSKSSNEAALFEDDSKLYTMALAKKEIGIVRPSQANEPIVLISNRYADEVDLRMAAAELGMTAQDFVESFKRIEDISFRRNIGVLTTKGGVLKRETFDQLFVDLSVHLGIGEKPLINLRPAKVKSPGSSSQTGNAGNDAMDAMQAGILAMRNSQWQQASELFSKAVKLTDDQVLRARICEQAIPLYERGEDIARLIDAHMHILVLCNNTALIDKARVNFFSSIMRFVSKSKNWSSSPAKSNSIQWNVEIPTSVSTAIVTAFEQKLNELPEHEPSLRVLQLFWQHVQDNPSKRQEILERLREILKKRRESLEIPASADLAMLWVTSGQFAKGAGLYAEIAAQVEGNRAAYFRIEEAEAWSKTEEKEQAIATLKRANRDLLRVRDSLTTTNLARIGDLYVQLEQPNLAKNVYLDALKGEKSAYVIEQLQVKIQHLKDDTERAVGNLAGQDKTEDLLDPSRPFRIRAEENEADAKRNDSLAFLHLTEAANNWLKANEPKRAEAAIRKAGVALRRQDTSNAKNDYEKLAELFEKIEMRQDAVKHYLESLKLVSYPHEIEKYQNAIHRLMEEDKSIVLSVEQTALVDPKYSYRLMAKQAEASQTHDATSFARKLVEAAQHWGKAENAQEAKRVGAKAESAIKKIASKATYLMEEKICKDLAEAYMVAGLGEDAIRAYVLAIQFSRRDDDAMLYFRNIEAICEEKGLQVPTLAPSSAAKLDPLNRYRTEAANYEKQAKEPSYKASAGYQYRNAIEAWIKAESKSDALRVAADYSQYLMKTPESREYDFDWLAKKYELLELPLLAIEQYQQVLSKTTSDNRKNDIRNRIKQLK